ncbi:MAG TPA: NapC/NirT family cytochrome c [Desulfosporosinus sp.]
MDIKHNEEAQASEVGQGKSHRRLKKLLLLSLLTIVVLIAAAIAGMHFTSQPSFCVSCHEMKSQVSAWSTSPHKDVTCLSCHSTPGTVGYVKAKINGLNELYVHATNQIPAKIEAKVDPAACISCHTGNTTYPKAKNIKLESGALAPRMPHAQVLKDNMSCLICHQFVGHGQPPNVATNN